MDATNKARIVGWILLIFGVICIFYSVSGTDSFDIVIYSIGLIGGINGGGMLSIIHHDNLRDKDWE